MAITRTSAAIEALAEAQIRDLRYVIEHGMPPSCEPVDWIFEFRMAFPVTNRLGRRAAIDAVRGHPDFAGLEAQFRARWPEVADIPLTMDLPDV